jgi:hypothetical protein
MTSNVLFLPWVPIDHAITLGDVTFHPFADALDLAGGRRDQLELFGSIYVDGYTLALAVQRGEPAPRIYPAVAFVEDDDADARKVRDAVDVLMLSTMLENDIDPANGATFSAVVRWLDGERGLIVDHTPRIHGSTTNGLYAETYFEMRPPRAGRFHHSRRPAMVEALVSALRTPFAGELRDVFDTLRAATSESADVSMDLAESLIAKATTLLVRLPATPDNKKQMLPRVRALLAPFIPDSTGDGYGFHIARVWQAVRDHRNEFWHPKPLPVDIFPFMGQRLVTPMLLATRMTHALLAARLIELGCAAPDGELRADVVAIERWISTLQPALEAGLVPVTDSTSMLARKERVDEAHAAFWRLRSNARFELAVNREMARPVALNRLVRRNPSDKVEAIVDHRLRSGGV